MRSSLIPVIIDKVLIGVFLISQFILIYHGNQFRYFFVLLCLLLIIINRLFMFKRSLIVKILIGFLMVVNIYFFLGPVLLFQKNLVEWNKKGLKQEQIEFTITLNKILDYPINIEKINFEKNDFSIINKNNRQIVLVIRQLNEAEYQTERFWLWYKIYEIPLVVNLYQGY